MKLVIMLLTQFKSIVVNLISYYVSCISRSKALKDLRFTLQKFVQNILKHNIDEIFIYLEFISCNKYKYRVHSMPQICTKMNGFKIDFSKLFWGGAHRAPSPDPAPNFSRALPSFRASPSVRALPSILRCFAPSTLASP